MRCPGNVVCPAEGLPRQLAFCPTAFSDGCRYSRNLTRVIVSIVDADQGSIAMGLRPLWVLGLFALASLGQAQEIHKCAGQDGVTYQNVPCPSGQQEQAFASIARNQNRQEQAPPSATRSENARDAYTSQSREANRYAGTPFAATTLFIGMTDTQVLNL